MRYLTVTEIAERIGNTNIESVEQQNKRVIIQIRGGLIERPCDICKSGSHTGASVMPRINIRNF